MHKYIFTNQSINLLVHNDKYQQNFYREKGGNTTYNNHKKTCMP